MTISSSTRKAGPFAGDDLTTEFAFAFKVFSASDLYVVKAVAATGVETVLALTTDYTVTLNADQNNNPGGTVLLNSALGAGYTLTLASQVSYTQNLTLTNQGAFYPAVINSALDRLTILTQQLNEQVQRCLRIPISSPDGSQVPTAQQILSAVQTTYDNVAAAQSAKTAAETARDQAAQTLANSDLASRIGSTGPASCRNKIRNPRFSVNQRAVSGTVTLAAGAFGHDGWKAGASGCTYTFSTTQGRTTLTISAGSLVQTVDGLDLAAGSNTHTLSWGGTCQGKIGAGSYGASGITGSAIGGTNISVEFGIGTLYEPQFEIGTIASAFDCLPDWLELERCRKYLPGLSGLYCPLGVGQALSATTLQLSIRFSPRPNARLTGLSISSPSHIQVLQADGSAVTPTGVTFNVGGQDGLTHINLKGLSGLVAGNACNIYGASASFRLLATGAEL